MGFLESIYEKSKVDNKHYYDEKVAKKVWDFFANEIPEMGYETREGQEDMAYDITDAIKAGENIIIEAGVGIGKSYAYLVPIIYYSRLINRPVVVSTSTILLQEQLKKDIQEIGKMLKIKPDVVLAKGMSHFKCIARGKKYCKHSNLKVGFRKWVNNPNVGDRAELTTNVSEQVWENINVKNCEYRKCPMYDKCYYMNRRKRMLNSKGIILCNHDLLAVDLQKKKNGERPILSNEIGLIVVDEGHNLEEKVRNSLKETHSYNEIISTIKEAEGYLRKYSRNIGEKKIEEAIAILKGIFFDFKEQVKYQKKQIAGCEGDIERYYLKKRDSIESKVTYMDKILVDLNTKVQLSGSVRDGYIQDEIIEKLNKSIRLFKGLSGEDTNYILWGELVGNEEDIRNIRILQCPKTMKKEISKLFFNNDGFKTIVTSATLTDSLDGEEEERYKYIVNTLGFKVGKRGTLSAPKESPYNYGEHMLVHYSNDMPHPTKERSLYIEKAVEKIFELINLTKGRTMVLFTAKSDMVEVYEALKERVEWKIIKQEEGRSQEALIKEFKDDKNSILLGTGAYWEGVSIEGETLSSLIIFRLPFTVPDPIIDYKKTLVDNPLMEVDVPEMIIKLKQGVGRLIRNSSDKGIVTILDSRISDNSNSKYKQHVWDALPTDNITNDINVVKDFITKHNIDN